MITPENSAQWIEKRYWRPQTYYGLSTDSKPTVEVANGAAFVEMDTASLYFFDLENGTWIKWEV